MGSWVVPMDDLELWLDLFKTLVMLVLSSGLQYLDLVRATIHTYIPATDFIFTMPV